MPPLNIFQLMNHTPWRSVIHFIHANSWVFLRTSLQTSRFWLFLPHGGYVYHSSENTAQLLLLHAAQKQSGERQTLMKHGLPKCCQRWRFDGSLVRGLRIMLSSPAVVWQKGILPAVCKDTAINLRDLTGTHYGAVSLLYHNRYYWWSICKRHQIKQRQQIAKKLEKWSPGGFFLFRIESYFFLTSGWHCKRLLHWDTYVHKIHHKPSGSAF